MSAFTEINFNIYLEFDLLVKESFLVNQPVSLNKLAVDHSEIVIEDFSAHGSLNNILTRNQNVALRT